MGACDSDNTFYKGEDDEGGENSEKKDQKTESRRSYLEIKMYIRSNLIE